MIDNGQLQLANGQKIDLRSGKVVPQITSINLPTVSAAQKLVAGTRRKISELPSVPERMHPIAVLLSYKLFGLDDDEIAIALNWPLEQVQKMSAMKEYADMHEAVVQSIMQSETNNVREIFTKYSRTAALKQVAMMDSESEVIAQNAVRDVLDRAGHRPADFITEQRSKMEAELIVKFVSDDKSVALPVIDVTPIRE